MAQTIPRPGHRGRDDNAAMKSPTVEQLDLSEGSTAVEVLTIQHAAYLVEADLIGYQGIPPLQEGLDELLARPLSWLGIRSPEGTVVAALGFVRTAEQVDIDRLMVAPECHGRGMARALVGALGEDVKVTVSTGTANTPARRLYESSGFADVGDELIEPGLSITHYEREAQV